MWPGKMPPPSSRGPISEEKGGVGLDPANCLPAEHLRAITPAMASLISNHATPQAPDKMVLPGFTPPG
jgi:hypothetical protein